MSANKKDINFIILAIALFIGIYINESIDIINISNTVKDFIVVFSVTVILYNIIIYPYYYIKNLKEKSKSNNIKK
ncbi:MULTISPECIES: hypothetical protein [Clostridium]|uniref:Uncharacterized protein n=1 Tax=Clostridium faecium TaxID=2762223 RepID=A0ABR8YPU1_9CLOT|nr:MULTISPECIES: hypothetical protein [Clostridium]MBD8045924.1 hypothetical protein [Clostridium faecium]MDU1348002.1 hypothetical protein [Clostridium argentinense]